MKNQSLVLAAAALLSAGGALLAAQNQKPLQTTAPNQEKNSARKAAVAWESSFEAALAQSKKSGKIVMIDFGAKWCGACKMMDEKTYPDAAVIAESKKFVMLKVDVDEQPELANRYGISSLPTTGWIHGDGKPIAGTVGALEPRDLIAAMREATKRAQKTK